MSLTITVDSALVLQRLEQLRARMDDLSPAFSAIGMEMEARVSRRFETQTDPNGHPWAAWSPVTKATYPKQGNGTVLDRYGDMLSSLGHEATATSATIGFGQPYAAYHEHGTKHMPRRGLLFDNPDTGTLSQDDEQAVLDILNRFIEEAIG